MTTHPVEAARKLLALAADDVEALPAALRAQRTEHPEGGELLALAAELGVLKAGFSAYRDFLLNHSRPWDDTGLDRAADDAHTVRQWGRLAAELDALDALFEEVADGTADPALAHRYAVALSETLHSEAIEVLGASATSGRFGLDRFRRTGAALRLEHPPVETLAGIGRALVASA